MHTPSSFGGTINVGGQYVSGASAGFHTYALEWSEARLSVFSSTGQKVMEVENYSSGSEIDLSDLSAGVYSYILKSSAYQSQASFVKL
jgi:beta-glucanase (GH16 family)